MLQSQPHAAPPAHRRSLLAIVKKLYEKFFEHRIPSVAAGTTFFFLLALFPALASMVSIYGLFADRASILDQLNLLSGFLPGGAVSVLTDDIRRLTAQKPETLNLTFAIGFALALWSTSGGITALIDALNIAFERKESRSFVRLTLHALAIALGSVIAASVIIYAGVEAGRILQRLPDRSAIELAAKILLWPLAFFICSAAFSLIYRYGPDRARMPWRWIGWGSGIAAIAWLLGTMAFSWYVQNYGSYNSTYGELGAAVGFLTWVWLSTVILLAGAEISSIVDEQGAH